MFRWATSSDQSRRLSSTLLVLAGLGLAAPGALRAQATLTQAQALRLAFPEPTTIERRSAFLGEEALHRVRAAAGVEVPSGVLSYYVGTRAGRPVGVAYFDAHRVRTLNEVLMLVVTPDSRIERIEVLRFQEPREYRAPTGWLDQVEGRRLGPELSLKGKVPPLTGATLTARAVTESARRVLALHAAIRPFNPASQPREK